MTHSIEPGDSVFVKGYRVLSLAENMGRNVGRSVSINLVC